MEPFEYHDRSLFAEAVPLAEIGARAGTPCYVYSATAILDKFRAYDAAFGDVPHMVCYAVKANSNLGLLKLLAAAGAGVRYRFRRRVVPGFEGRRAIRPR